MKLMICILLSIFIIIGCVSRFDYSDEFDNILEYMDKGNEKFNPQIKVIYLSVFSDMAKRNGPRIDERIQKAIDKGIDGEDLVVQYQTVSKSMRTILYRELRRELSKERIDFDRVYDLYESISWVVNRRKDMTEDPEKFVETPDILLRKIKSSEDKNKAIEEFQDFMDEVFLMSFSYEMTEFIKAKEENDEEHMALKILEARFYLESFIHRLINEDNLDDIVKEINKKDHFDIDPEFIISEIEKTMPTIRDHIGVENEPE